MFVSVEFVAIIVSALGLALTMGTTMFLGFSWCVRRIDAVDTKLSTRIDQVEEKLNARIDRLETTLNTRIDRLETTLNTRIDRLEESLTARIDAVALDVTEVKIGVARIEGPVRRLVLPRR